MCQTHCHVALRVYHLGTDLFRISPCSMLDALEMTVGTPRLTRFSVVRMEISSCSPCRLLPHRSSARRSPTASFYPVRAPHKHFPYTPAVPVLFPFFLIEYHQIRPGCSQLQSQRMSETAKTDNFRSILFITLLLNILLSSMSHFSFHGSIFHRCSFSPFSTYPIAIFPSGLTRSPLVKYHRTQSSAVPAFHKHDQKWSEFCRITKSVEIPVESQQYQRHCSSQTMRPENGTPGSKITRM